MASAKEILAEGLLSGSPVLTGLSFEICDENRKLLFRFPSRKLPKRPALDLDLAKKPGNAGEL